MKKWILLAAAFISSTSYAINKQEISKRFGVDTSTMTLSDTPVFSGKFYALSDPSGQTIYLSSDLRYAVSGTVIDQKTGNPIGAKSRAERKFDWKDFNPTNAIQIGSGPHKVIVFADPRCGYCKKLEAELNRLQDQLTVYIVQIPILGPESEAVSTNVWCSNDQAQAWKTIMSDQQLQKASDCVNPTDSNLQLAKKYGITGTPAIVFPDGHIVPGFIPASEIERQLKAN